jgi:hypothetical protein
MPASFALAAPTTIAKVPLSNVSLVVHSHLGRREVLPLLPTCVGIVGQHDRFGMPTNLCGIISRMDQRVAVAKGYLPKELPPVFSSATLGRALSSLTQSRPTGVSSATKFSLARAGGLRRPAATPNPFAHLELVDLCVANWAKLRAVTARSPISASRPYKARRQDLRSLQFSGGNDRFDRLRLTQGAKFTLQTDISNFYSSIYTHAVDWAIRGKSVAK